MGIETATFRTKVGRSNYWATKNSSGEQWSIVGLFIGIVLDGSCFFLFYVTSPWLPCLQSFPWNPAGHRQWKLPKVFTHVLPLPHGLCWHSSMSAAKEGKKSPCAFHGSDMNWLFITSHTNLDHITPSRSPLSIYTSYLHLPGLYTQTPSKHALTRGFQYV